MSIITYAVLVLLLASWAAVTCSDCTGCGGCLEPTGGTPNSSFCTPDASPGYDITPWPAISGSGCLPGGNCQRFANQKFCLRWVSDSLWQSTRVTIDCTTTYGVFVDIQWEMSLDLTGHVTLKLNVYLTGTSTLVALMVQYEGSTLSTACGYGISAFKTIDGGQCLNWPQTLFIAVNCCTVACTSDCPVLAPGSRCSSCGPRGLDSCCAYMLQLQGASSGPSCGVNCPDFNAIWRVHWVSDCIYHSATTIDLSDCGFGLGFFFQLQFGLTAVIRGIGGDPFVQVDIVDGSGFSIARWFSLINTCGGQLLPTITALDKQFDSVCLGFPSKIYIANEHCFC